jgi:hypothetical protein
VGSRSRTEGTGKKIKSYILVRSSDGRDRKGNDDCLLDLRDVATISSASEGYAEG